MYVDQKCWECEKAVPKKGEEQCPWAVYREPVPGWNARPVMRMGIHGRMFKSYEIKDCPLFKKG